MGPLLRTCNELRATYLGLSLSLYFAYMAISGDKQIGRQLFLNSISRVSQLATRVSLLESRDRHKDYNQINQADEIGPHFATPNRFSLIVVSLSLVSQFATCGSELVLGFLKLEQGNSAHFGGLNISCFSLFFVCVNFLGAKIYKYQIGIRYKT